MCVCVCVCVFVCVCVCVICMYIHKWQLWNTPKTVGYKNHLISEKGGGERQVRFFVRPRGAR
jgi:hypothetical protein